MADIAAQVHSLGGLAQKQQLVRRGATDLDLTRAVKSGAVTRARQGWYSTLAASDPRFRAARVGGRLTGISAIAAMGGWVLGEHPLHVAVPRNAARLRSQWDRHERMRYPESGGVIVHWDSGGHDTGSAHTVSLMTALRDLFLDENFEEAVAALDWAMHTGLFDEIDLHRLIRALPADFAELADWADIDCESLPESLGRTRMRLRGHAVRSQVDLTSGERLDLVVDECVGLETDGEQFHRDRFERDRLKDLAIAIDGYHGIRVSARTVFHAWPLAEAAIEAALAQHGVVPPFGNSGVRRGKALRAPGFARFRRQELRRTPEFPRGVAGGAGNRAGAGARWPKRE
jgi:very-short-patch-repair endonuclease